MTESFTFRPQIDTSKESPFDTLQELRESNAQLSNASLLHPDRTVVQKLKDNTLAPIYNTLQVTPINALCNAINPILPADRVLPKLEKLSVERTAFGSTPWLLQSISAGLAGAAVFAITGKLSSAAFSHSGMKIPESISMIFGGSVLEGLRDNEPGESHLGNLLAGTTMLAAFETGNYMSKGLLGPRLQLARAATGAIATMLSSITSSAVSRGELPEHIGYGTATGASMNVLLPALLGRVPLPNAKTSVKDPDKFYDIEPLSSSARTEVRRNIEEKHFSISDLRMEDLGISREPWRISLPSETVEMAKGFSSYGEYVRNTCQDLQLPFRNYQLHSGTLLRYPERVPNYSRLTPKELAALIQELPDPALIKTLTVSDYPHYDSGWISHIFRKPNLKIKGDTDGAGNVNLYRPENLADTRKTLVHEFTHNMKNVLPAESKEFDSINKVEPVQLMGESQHFIDSTDEAWARLGESLLTDSPEQILLTASMNPNHSRVFSRGLRKIVESANSTGKKRAFELVDYIDKCLD